MSSHSRGTLSEDSTHGNEELQPLHLTNRRAWAIAFLLFVGMTINFVDRLVLSSIAPILRFELHFSNTQYSYIVFAFMAGMTLGQLPASIFIDWIGTRVALPTLMAGWSVCNALQAFPSSVFRVAGLRFLMGVFECGSYPSGLKAIGSLFPARSRGLALGLFNSGSLVGSVIAPPIIVYVASRFGWRAAFWLPSSLGLLWMWPWFQICEPKILPRSTQGASSNCSNTIFWLFRQQQTWGVILTRALAGPVSNFYWYWLPLYLVRERGLNMLTMAGLVSFVYIVAGVGQLMGGHLSGFLITRDMGTVQARKVAAVAGCILALSSILIPFIRSVHLASLFMGLAVFGLSFIACNLIAVMTDVFPQAVVGRVTGLTGIGEGLVSMVLTIATGALIDRFSFGIVFIATGLMPLISVLALVLIVRYPLNESPSTEALGLS